MELNRQAIAFGIGRKATKEELVEYLSRSLDETPIPLEEAMLKYRPISDNQSTDNESKPL